MYLQVLRPCYTIIHSNIGSLLRLHRLCTTARLCITQEKEVFEHSCEILLQERESAWKRRLEYLWRNTCACQRFLIYKIYNIPYRMLELTLLCCLFVIFFAINILNRLSFLCQWVNDALTILKIHERQHFDLLPNHLPLQSTGYPSMQA